MAMYLGSNKVAITKERMIPELTTATVTAGESYQYITKDTEVRTLSFTRSPMNCTDGSFTTETTSLNPESALVDGQEYILMGHIDVLNTDSEKIESYIISTTITWNVTEQVIITNESTAYYKKFALKKSTSDNTKAIIYAYFQKNDKYGFICNLSIKMATDYDGLSLVTVNPVTYSDSLIRYWITRDSYFQNFTFPPNVTSIGVYAFAHCTYLKLTELPSSLRSIGAHAFDHCAYITLTSLPDTITSIGDNAFNQCSRLALTSLPTGLTQISSYSFYNCQNLAISSLPSGVTTISDNAFNNCTSITLSSLPSGVTEIGNGAFSGCTSITLSSLPSSITKIRSNAFKTCTGITSISCSGAITILGSGAFYGSNDKVMQLSSVSFPNMTVSSLESVFGSTTAAYACQLLEFCDLGFTGSINYGNFANCYALETLILRKTSSICTLSNVNAFANTPMSGYNSKTGTVYVPSALISTYQTATNWSTLYNAGTVNFVAIEGSEYEI